MITKKVLIIINTQNKRTQKMRLLVSLSLFFIREEEEEEEESEVASKRNFGCD